MKSIASKYLTLSAFVLCALAAAAQNDTLHTIKVKSAKDLQRFFRYTGTDVPLISGHRGGIVPGYPENSIEAMEHTLRYTPAFFEVDPRLTKDSIIVLMHDATLERTTNGKGKLSDYTWEEVKQFRLKDKAGNLTPYRIPSLEEAIRWAKGKTILNLDKKDVPLAMTAKLIRDMKAEGWVMVTVHSAEQARFYHEENKDIVFSAFVLKKEAIDEYEKAGVPWNNVMAYVGPNARPENKELLNALHARGVMCMISAAPTYDKLKTEEEREAAYKAIINSGANVIESDLPIEAANAVRSLHPADSKKRKFFGRQIVPKPDLARN